MTLAADHFRANVKNYQRDGPMTVTSNQEGAPNYFPNSFSGPVDHKAFLEAKENVIFPIFLSLLSSIRQDGRQANIHCIFPRIRDPFCPIICFKIRSRSTFLLKHFIITLFLKYKRPLSGLTLEYLFHMGVP